MGKGVFTAIGLGAMLAGMTAPGAIPMAWAQTKPAAVLTGTATPQATETANAAERKVDRERALEEVRDLFPHTTARPLFRADRRPAPSVPVAAVPVPAPAPLSRAAESSAPPEPRIAQADYVLTGVVQSDTRSLAMLESTRDGTTHVIKPGRARLPGRDGAMVTIDVTQIAAGHVTFVADTVLTLHLYDAAPSDTASMSAERVPGRALRFAETVAEEDRRTIRLIASDMALPEVPPALRPDLPTGPVFTFPGSPAR